MERDKTNFQPTLSAVAAFHHEYNNRIEGLLTEVLFVLKHKCSCAHVLFYVSETYNSRPIGTQNSGTVIGNWEGSTLYT